MTLFSLNINKIALLRNSRGGDNPSLDAFAREAIDAGVRGLTVHPRSDQRHITKEDVATISKLPEVVSHKVEFNIEGDLRPDLLELVERVRPTQFTVVPVTPGEVTSNRGWQANDDHDALAKTVKRLDGVRIAVFCDVEERSCRHAVEAGAHAVEFYTGPYAAAHARNEHADVLRALENVAARVREHGLRLNGGHDLSLENLPTLLSRVRLDEVSIGHQVTVDALRMGWRGALGAYLKACA